MASKSLKLKSLKSIVGGGKSTTTKASSFSFLKGLKNRPSNVAAIFKKNGSSSKKLKNVLSNLKKNKNTF